MASVNLKELDDHYHVEFHSNSISILHLPPFQNGLMDWLQSFANVYYAYPNQDLIDKLSKTRLKKSHFKRLFLESHENLVGHKTFLCDVALNSSWDTPVFVSKLQNQYSLMTGNGKIIAQKVAKKLPENFKCIFVDYDKTHTNDWNIIRAVHTDQDLNDVLGCSWHLEIELVKLQKNGFYPKVIYFNLNKNNQFDASNTYVDSGRKTLDFIKSRLRKKNNMLLIYLHDKHDSNIFDSSGIFQIVKCKEELDNFLAPNEVRHNSQFGLGNTVEGRWYFHTNQKIEFDLADLLFYVRKDHTLYYNATNDFITWIECKDHLDKQICTAS